MAAAGHLWLLLIEVRNAPSLPVLGSLQPPTPTPRSTRDGGNSVLALIYKENLSPVLFSVSSLFVSSQTPFQV